MKKDFKNFDNRERFNRSIPRESLWYYSEDPALTSSSGSEEEKNEMKLDNYKKLIREKNHQLISRAAQKNTFKREVAFVVDWEMSDLL